MKHFDVVALGELLIDFTQNGLSEQGNGLFEANPGGAPGNVLAMLSRLGHRTSFIGKVGEDRLGHVLAEALEELDIDTRNLCFDVEIPTTLAMVSKTADGDRSFSFYRKPGADIMLKKEELQTELLADTRIFHFGSLSLTEPSIRETTREAVRMAKEAGALISFDPNLREPLWESLDVAAEQILWGIRQCDFLKISDNEIQWLSGCEDFTDGVEWIREQADIPLICVSLGKDGSRAYTKSGFVEEPAFLQEHVTDTTGAGDTFCACVLHDLLTKGPGERSEEELRSMLRFANAAASLITTKKGALRVMPTREEVEHRLSNA